MAVISLPFDKGRKLSIDVPDQNLMTIALPRFPPPALDPMESLKQAIQSPIGTSRLTEKARRGHKVAIAVTDITRNSPDALISKILIDELVQAGVREEDIYFFIALGSHRPMTREEIEVKLGPRIARRFRVINHDWREERELLFLGRSNGFPISINRLAAEADLKITTGIIEPHLFAGYSGGVKTTVIGLAGFETIGATHGYRILNHPGTRVGVIKGNIFQEFIRETGKLLGIDFIVNCLMDSGKGLIRAFAGHPIQAYDMAFSFARRAFEVEIPELADIVIACPGYPKSLNLYQATRVCNPLILGSSPVVRKGGIIIIPAPCTEGLGEETFRLWLKDTTDGESIMRKAEDQGFPIGAHKGYIIGRYISHAEVVVAGSEIPVETLREVKMTPMPSVERALDYALGKLGHNARLLVVPYGIITLPVIKKRNIDYDGEDNQR